MQYGLNFVVLLEIKAVRVRRHSPREVQTISWDRTNFHPRFQIFGARTKYRSTIHSGLIQS